VNPNTPPPTGDATLLIWGVMFGILVAAAVVLAFLNRKRP
jgi:cytochrome c-type biogenesis protein CcmH/NrfF